MARRNGRPGEWLATDDYTGFTRYASELKRDYWGMYAQTPLKRNLQEIATPLSDPYPVAFYRGPNYESFDPAEAETAPVYVGETTVPTNPNNMAYQVLGLGPAAGNTGVGFWTIGTDFEVQ